MDLISNLLRPKHSDRIGFWGPITSSVDWCESNYETSYYVAEFFNSISSLAMVSIGLFGIMLHPWTEKRFKVAFLTVVILGLGSVVFHTTLYKEGQALDEVPMLYSALTFLFILLAQRLNLSKRARTILATVLVIHAIFTTWLVTASKGAIQFIMFHVSFNSSQAVALVNLWLIYRERKRLNRPNDPALYIFERGLMLYLCAIIVWLIDLFGCQYLNTSYSTAVVPINPQFHSWWHALVSGGLYDMVLIVLLDHVEKQGKQGTLRFYAGFLPYIHIESAKQD